MIGVGPVRGTPCGCMSQWFAWRAEDWAGLNEDGIDVQRAPVPDVLQLEVEVGHVHVGAGHEAAVDEVWQDALRGARKKLKK